jgi:DNA topoisomerase-1
MSLIIVESPTKARTFNRLLKGKGTDYFVFATMGHIRDLPGNKMSIDFDKQFKPDYRIIPSKQKIVTELKKLADQHEEIILATDLDREGESISYHVAYILGFIKESWPSFTIKTPSNKKPIKRIVFHEITEKALEHALKNPENLRVFLIQAQQGRRILDRIVGYELSPLLWKKIGKNWLSAGRVQTVALRIIVEREKEIKKFESEEYCQIYGNFSDHEIIKAKLIKKNDIPYEQSFKINLFDGEYTFTKTTISKVIAPKIQKDLETDTFTVSNIKETVFNRFPPPPHTTSLLQQDAFHTYGFSSKMTMKLAQDLYERGLITYHRTDSFTLSTQFVISAMKYITKKYGKEYALEKPREYKTKSKNAQEAHEAIRPTNLSKDIPAISEDSSITSTHKKLYQLIFDRTIATQMKEAQIKQIKISILGSRGYLFESDIQQVLFDGFLKVLNPEFVQKNINVITLKAQSSIKLKTLEIQENKTKPPPRYNEASLIKSLEEKGIGRPSTYAPIISLIQEKYYVEKDNRAFFPTLLGTAISDYLSEAFPKLFSIDFTSHMEDDLDNIAEGNKKIVDLLELFYKPFKTELETKKNDITVIDVEEDIKENCPKCKGNLTIRFSKFGKFLACSNFPKCRFTKPFLKYIPDKKCPKCGGGIVIRFTKKRRKFFGCEKYPECMFSSWKLNF